MTIRESTSEIKYVADTGWHEVGSIGEPAFTNSWSNYDNIFSSAAFRIDGEGWVHLKGLVKNGTLSTSVFTLPGGYLPGKSVYFPIVSNNSPGFCRIGDDGTVIVDSYAGSNAFCSLDGIQFPVMPIWEFNRRWESISGWAPRPLTTNLDPHTMRRDNGFLVVGGIAAGTSAANGMTIPRDYYTSTANVTVDYSANVKNFEVRVSGAGSLTAGTTAYSILGGEFGIIDNESSWISPSMSNSWVGYGIDDVNRWTPAQYMRDKYGYIHIRGMVKSGSSASAVIFNLPSGLRPAKTQIFPVITGFGSGVGRVDITSSGNVSCTINGSTAYTSLCGIHFYPG